MASTEFKSNSPQQPGISGRSNSHDPPWQGRHSEGILYFIVQLHYPSTTVDEVATIMQAQNLVACTSHVTQTWTTDAPGTEALYNVEGTVKSSVPISAGTDLKESITNPHPKQQTTHKLRDALHQGDVTTAEQERSTRLKTSPDIPLSESFGNMKISSKPTALPSALQDQYYFSTMAHDIDYDLLDLNEVIYEDAPIYGDERSFEARDSEARDRAGDQARGGYLPGDGSTPVDRGYGEGDVTIGHCGVTYNRSGRGGVLPQYPTQEGTNKNRMMDDPFRLVGVDNRTSMSTPAVISRSTNSSEGYPTNLPSTRNDVRRGSGEERTVPCLDFRIIEERRETPVVESDPSDPI